MGPFNRILAPQPSRQVLSKPKMTFNTKAKLVVTIVRPQKYFQTLTLLVFGAIRLCFSPLSIWASTLQAQDDLDLKGKVVSINVSTLNIISYLNPIGHGGYLTLYQSPSHLGKYFPGLGQVISRPNVTLTSKAKFSVT